jgi:hypothetical protein
MGVRKVPSFKVGSETIGPWFAKKERHGAAAFQNLAELIAFNLARQRRGVRQPDAALVVGTRLAK